VTLFPTILNLSQYMLKVTGLKANSYVLRINGVSLTTLTAKQLESGVNLAGLGPATQASSGVNPIVAHGRAILSAVAAKEALVSQWRSLSQRAHAAGAAPELKEQLVAFAKNVEEADEGIRAAARAQKLQFEIAPVP
jgi:hypothetical protein